MYFKLECAIRGLLLDSGAAPTELTYGGPHHIVVEIRRPEPKDNKGRGDDLAACKVISKQEPSPKNLAVFEGIATDKPPAGWEGIEEWKNYLDGEGRIAKGGWKTSITAFPQGFQEYVRQVERELRDVAERAGALLRWRCSVAGHHEPLYGGHYSWSLDGQFWRTMPGTFSFVGQATPLIKIPPQVAQQVSELLAAGASEPLGHELLREAQWVWRDARRRSLLMAVAAAEVGFKECVAKLAPQCEWLIKNVPSPELVRMLRDFLPLLEAKCNFGGQVVAPPDEEVLKPLRNIVNRRNQIIHAGQDAPDDEFMYLTFRVVEDVLWILDYYSGFPWALNFVSPEVRQKMEEDAAARSKRAGRR